MLNPRILILGISGMLGHKLFNAFHKDGFEVFGTIRNEEDASFFPNKLHNRILTGINANDFNSVIEAIDKTKPDIIINCIGIIKQLKEASDPLISISVNALFPHQLAEYTKNKNIRIIHMSTDCIFDGKKGFYSENDESNPFDLYSKTKELGELIHYDHALTIRTSMIGPELKVKKSLFEWFKQQIGPIKGYSHAIFSGFPTIEIYSILKNFIIPNKTLKGVYHVSSAPISKFDLLNKINSVFLTKIQIEDDSSFLCDRSLDSKRFQKETNYAPPGWDELILKMYNDINENK